MGPAGVKHSRYLVPSAIWLFLLVTISSCNNASEKEDFTTLNLITKIDGLKFYLEYTTDDRIISLFIEHDKINFEKFEKYIELY